MKKSNSSNYLVNFPISRKIHRIPPVAVVVLSLGLEENDHEGHERLDKTELEGGLFAEPEEPYRVRLVDQAARQHGTARPAQ